MRSFLHWQYVVIVLVATWKNIRGERSTVEECLSGPLEALIDSLDKGEAATGKIPDLLEAIKRVK